MTGHIEWQRPRGPGDEGLAQYLSERVLFKEDIATDLSDPAQAGKLVTAGLVDAFPGIASSLYSPYAEGAVGDGVADDTDAINTFLASCAQRDYGAVDFSGTFRTTDTLAFPDVGSDYTKYFTGAALIRPEGSFGAALKLGSGQRVHFDHLDIVGPGTQSDWSSRTIECAVLLQGAARFQANFLYASMFAFGGLVGDRNFNNNSVSVADIKMFNCGSGHRSGAVYRGLSTDWEFVSNAGSSKSTGQTSKLSVTVLPPDYLLDGTYGTVNNNVILICLPDPGEPLGYRYHYVRSVDPDNMTIDVYPWLHSGADTSGTTDYAFGGGIVTTGNNNNVWSIGGGVVNTSGIGINVGALYGLAVGGVLNLTGLGIAAVVGERTNQSCIGNLVNAYVESNRLDIGFVTAAVSGSRKYHVFKLNGVVDSTKVAVLGGARSSNNAFETDLAKLVGVEIFLNGKRCQSDWVANNDTASTVTIDVNHANYERLLYRNSGTIAFAALSDLARLFFEHDRGRVTVIGTGTGGAPTGTITFTPPTDWTVNGGSTAAFSSFNSLPGKFLFYYDQVNTDVLVFQI